MKKVEDTSLKLWERFLLFEKNNNLFDIIDSNGICIWDIVRYEVYANLLWHFSSSPPSIKKRITPLSLINVIRKELSVISLFFSPQKDILIHLASRNRVGNKYVDQNADLAFRVYGKEERLIIETLPILKHLKYFSESYSSPSSLHLLRLFYKKHSYNFDELYAKIHQEFPSISFSVQQLNKIYNRFYFEKSYYSSILRRKKVAKVFFTQNGIQKGLICAAKRLNIPVYEFQHGIVDVGHLAYSYPRDESIIDKVYLPDKIASLSDFWFKDLYLPGVEIVPVGSDFFYKEKLPLSGEKNLLIISANVFGETLKGYLYRLFEHHVLLDYKIYFKLHPNQFCEYNKYKEYFLQYPNIIVLTDQKSIVELLKICNTLFTIQSTSIYEALQSGRKVLLLKESSANVFDNENMHLVDSIDSFKKALDAPWSDELAFFFSPADSELFEKEFVL